jgi:hypothetical protein
MSGNTVNVIGLDVLAARAKGWPGEIDAAVAREIGQTVRPLIGHMGTKASAIGGAAKVASRSLGLAVSGDAMTVRAGGAGLSGTLLMGGEFGGRKRPRRPYAYRSRSGNAYIAKRRATMQFKPHLGRRGYWFWPTVRTDLKGINARVSEILAKVANG